MIGMYPRFARGMNWRSGILYVTLAGLLLLDSGVLAAEPEWYKTAVPVCVVSLERDGACVSRVFVRIGSATLISDGRHCYAATARHVARGRDSIYIEVPRASGAPAQIQLGGVAKYDFIFPADSMLDLALAYVELPEDADVRVFNETNFAVPEELVPGMELRIVGYATFAAMPVRAPIAKAGMVSVSPDSTGYYYIDSNVFPGYSGSAAVIPPGPTIAGGGLTIGGRSALPRLAGVLVGYVPYCDTAVSKQTERPRVVFEENSGITLVVTPQALLRFLKERK